MDGEVENDQPDSDTMDIIDYYDDYDDNEIDETNELFSTLFNLLEEAKALLEVDSKSEEAKEKLGLILELDEDHQRSEGLEAAKLLIGISSEDEFDSNFHRFFQYVKIVKLKDYEAMCNLIPENKSLIENLIQKIELLHQNMINKSVCDDLLFFEAKLLSKLVKICLEEKLAEKAYEKMKKLWHLIESKQICLEKLNSGRKITIRLEMIKLEFQVLNFTRRHKTYLRIEYLYDKAKELWEHLNTNYYVTSEASNFMLCIKDTMARMYMYQQKYNHAFDLFNELFTTSSSDSCGFYHQGSTLAYICLLKNTKNVVHNVKNLSDEFLEAYLKNDIEKLNEVVENRRSEMIEKGEKFIKTQIEIMLEEVKVEKNGIRLKYSLPMEMFMDIFSFLPASVEYLTVCATWLVYYLSNFNQLPREFNDINNLLYQEYLNRYVNRSNDQFQGKEQERINQILHHHSNHIFDNFLMLKGNNAPNLLYHKFCTKYKKILNEELTLEKLQNLLKVDGETIAETLTNYSIANQQPLRCRSLLFRPKEIHGFIFLIVQEFPFFHDDAELMLARQSILINCSSPIHKITVLQDNDASTSENVKNELEPREMGLGCCSNFSTTDGIRDNQANPQNFQTSSGTADDSNKKDKHCLNCGQDGHWAISCPEMHPNEIEALFAQAESETLNLLDQPGPSTRMNIVNPPEMDFPLIAPEPVIQTPLQEAESQSNIMGPRGHKRKLDLKDSNEKEYKKAKHEKD